nr:hypothetical protein [Tanacetum cinerariifolium]
MNQNNFEPNPCYEPNSFSFDQYQPLQSFVTQQLPQRSNEDIMLEMAKLIKNNRILLNDNIFPHEEASIELLLAKERILKLIQAWDDKKIESWSFSAFNDSRTIDEILKQREQAANLAVQQEQEEQEDDEEMLQSREKFMKDIQTFLQKFSRYSFGVMPKFLLIAREIFSEIKHAFTDKQYQPEEIQELMCKLLEDVRNIREELAEYINSLSWNRPTFYDDDEEHSVQYEEFLRKFFECNHKVIKSSVEKLVQISSECEVTSDNESECDVPVCEDSSTFDVLKDHYEILSDSNNDDILSDDDTFEDIDINRLIADTEFLNDNPTPDRMLKSSSSIPIFEKFDNSLSYSDNSLLEFETFSDHMEETRSGSTTVHANNSLLEYDSFCFEIEPDQERLTSIVTKDISDDSTNDPLLEEVNLFLALDNSIPPGIENFDYNSEWDIYFLEGLLRDDFIPLPENKSYNFNHHDDPSFPLPPLKPPDVKFLFNFEPDSGKLISVMKNNIDELNEDECFDLGEERLMFLKMLKMTISFPSYLSFEFFYHISFTLKFLLCFSPLGVKTPFLTLASPLRASGISLGWNFHVL